MPLFWQNNFTQRQNFAQQNFNQNSNGSLFSRLFYGRQNQSNNQSNNLNNNMQNSLFAPQYPMFPQNQANQISQNPIFPQQPVQQLPQQDNNGVIFKPLTEEEMNSINDEIKTNIEKTQKQEISLNIKDKEYKEDKEDKEDISNYLKEFIQNEKNGNIFYNSLADTCNNGYYRDRLKRIGDECDLEIDLLKGYYKQFNDEEFSPEDLPINIKIPLKQGLYFAIEEEMKSYNKICDILDKVSYEQTSNFYKMALKKLSRINNIQFMAMDKNM